MSDVKRDKGHGKVLERGTLKYMPGTPMEHETSYTVYKKSVQELMTELKTRKEKDKRWIAQLLGEQRDVRTVDALIEVLASRDAMLRAYAAEALGKIGSARKLGAQVIPPLLPLLRDPSPSVRERTVVALGMFDEPEEDAILELVDDPNWRVRGVVAWALGNTRSESVLEALIQLSKDSRSAVRVMAMLALGLVGGTRAVHWLFEHILNRGDRVEGSAQAALRNMKHIASEDVIPYLSDHYWRRRALTCELLGRIGNAAAKEALIPMLADEKYKVRMKVLDAFWYRISSRTNRWTISGPRTISVLIELLGDSSEYVRNKAFDVLKRIGNPAADVVWQKLQSEDWSKYPTIRFRMKSIVRHAELKGWQNPSN